MWVDVCGFLVYSEVPYEGMLTNQLKTLVQRTRRGEHADWEGAISMYPLVKCDDHDDRLFLQFNANVNIAQKLQKLLGFGHPDLIHNLKYCPVHLFVDCTFSCVPRGFSQCLVIMAYDQSTTMYVPIFYVLMQTKQEAAYKHAFRLCSAAANDKMDIVNATCDFEKGLINALKNQFKSKPIIGCEFHWKQAIRRKLKDLNISRDQITALVDARGLLNLLTVIPIEDIENKGIPYIREHFDEGQDKPKFDNFWKYFVTTWMTQYNPEDWNIYGANHVDVASKDFILNRTNNPLERFNRKLNSCFSNRHPTVVQFMTGIKRLSVCYAKELLNIRLGRTIPPRHKPAPSYPIPSDYASFQSDATLRKSLYGQLAEYRFMENTCHLDTEDNMLYRITRVAWRERRKGERHIVAHRVLRKLQQGYITNNVEVDFISIEKAMEYLGVPAQDKSAADSMNNIGSSTTTHYSEAENTVLTSTPPRTPSYGAAEGNSRTDRVHCQCVKSDGSFCKAKLQETSPLTKKNPCAMYWTCARGRASTVSTCLVNSSFHFVFLYVNFFKTVWYIGYS